jgi:hypothetical protein
LCITMWTESVRSAKRRAAARACIAVREISPALSCRSRCSAWR